MKTTALTKKIALLSLIFLFACEQQEILQLAETREVVLPSIKVQSTTIDELPNLADKIQNTTIKSGFNWASKNDGESILLDDSRVMSVKDSLNNTTYSIRMRVPDSPFNVFYNVIVKHLVNGEMNEPFVIKYEVDEAYAYTYFTSKREEAPFKGQMSVFNLDAFEGIDQIYGRGDFEPEPCYSSESGDGDGGSSGNGGSSGGGGGTEHDPGATFTYHPVAFAPDLSPSVEVGEGEWGNYGSDGSLKRINTGKNDDCPEEELLIPINEEGETPPSCKSFNYEKTSDNWQECNVKGIYFEVWVTRTAPPYLQYKYTVHIDEAVNFGAPLFDRFGNELDSGSLASASALALHQAIRATVHEFDASAVNNPSDIDIFFKEKLRDEFPLHIIGGRATPNTTSELQASQYKATTDPNFDGCHNN